MTRAEAIIIIERVQHTEAKWPGTEDTLEALDLALAALHFPTREMVERMRGKWQSIHGLSEYYCSRCGEEFEIHTYDKEKYRFCPYCMTPMTDEAVDMMLGRWREELENERNNG